MSKMNGMNVGLKINVIHPLLFLLKKKLYFEYQSKSSEF